MSIGGLSAARLGRMQDVLAGLCRARRRAGPDGFFTSAYQAIDD